MTYSIKAEAIESGWIFHVWGGFKGSNIPKYHNKKAKISLSSMQIALEKALTQLNINNHPYSIKVETIADKQAVIDFYRKPIPKLFKKLEQEFSNSDEVYVYLINENTIGVTFRIAFIDDYNVRHKLSAKINNSQVIFNCDNDFLKRRYQKDINKIIDIVKG